MIKKIFATALIFTAIISSSAFAENNLREPQGRIGKNYKTEKYTPLGQTNLTAYELGNLNKIIKQEEKDKISAKKAEKKALLEQQKAEKKAIINEKKAAERELAAKQKAEKIAKKAEEKAIADKKKAEERALKAEEKNKTILSHKKENTEQKEPKLSFKLGKKQKPVPADEESAVSGEENLTENEITAKEEPVKIGKKYAQDRDTKNIVNEITEELSSGREQMLRELSTLWVSAVQKSDTVYFAIMKLSNPNGEEVNKNGFKKIMEPIIGAAPLVGQAFVNPALTAGSIIGSNVMGSMMDNSAKLRLSKVNDADLVILAREIDELQEKLILNYMSYKGAKEEYELAIKIAEERKKEYEAMDKKNSPNTILANTFYTEALDYQYKARQEFLMKRVVLEQMVGAEALNEIENPQKEETAQEESRDEENK